MMAPINGQVFDSRNNNIKLGHLNVCSLNPSKSKFLEIYEIIQRSKLDVIGISETWLTEHTSTKAVEIEGYSFERCDRMNQRGGGVGLYISTGFVYNVLFQESFYESLHSRFELLVVEIVKGDSKIIVGVLYVPPSVDILCAEGILSELSLKHENIVLMGDLNCNLLNLTSTACSRLISLSTRNNLHLVHNNSPTHFDAFHRSFSLLDVFLVDCDSKVREFKVLSIPSNISKHCLIALRYDFIPKVQQKSFKFRNLDSIDVIKLFEYVNRLDLNFILRLNDVNGIAEQLNHLCLHLLDKFAPFKTKYKKKRDKFPFMNSPEIKHFKGLRDMAYHDYMADDVRSPEKWRLYCILRNRVTKLIKAKKKEFSESYFNESNSKVLWKKINSSGAGSSNSSELPLSFNLNDLNKHFCNIPSNNIFTPQFDLIPDSPNAFSFRNIDLAELLIHLHAVKSNAVGFDEIPIKFVIQIFPVIGKYLLHLFNTVLTTSSFPECWKVALVNPIPKKKTPIAFNDVRPVSILPALSKAMEIVMRSQMDEKLDFDELLYKYQSGFRKNFNTTTAMLDITDSIRQMNDRGLCTFLFSFDLSRAFDMVDHKLLVYKLKTRYSFSNSACNLLKSFLSNRKQMVFNKGSFSELEEVNQGVPQGAILSPLLFSLFLNDLASAPASMMKLRFFADDIQSVVCCRPENQESFIRIINEELQRIYFWCLNNGLRLNESKTNVMNFCKSVPSSHFNNCFQINNHYLSLVDELTCLGFTIDRKLCWDKHIDQVIRKINYGLKSLYQCNLNLPFSVRKKLAHALLMSRLVYGIEIFSGTGLEFLNKLRKCFNKIIRFVYKIPWRGHVTEFVKKFIGCNFNNFIAARCLIMLYKTLKFKQPQYLLRRFVFSRSQRTLNINTPTYNRRIMKLSFCFRASQLWNRWIPMNIRDLSLSISTFKLNVKSYLE